MKHFGHKRLDPVFESLRAAAGTATDLGKIDAWLDRLHQELDLVLREHAGMAEELLRAYEQLGIVFEVTRNLPTVQAEPEVVRLFIDSLNVTYHDELVCSAAPLDSERLSWSTVPGARVAVEAVVQDCINTKKVAVHRLPQAIDGVAEVLTAPVFAGRQFFCAIVLTHGPEARRFEASDMSLVEALALFCGDLIRNYQLGHELRRLSVDMVRALVNAIDQKDEYTSGHSNRVGYFAKLLGEELALDHEELQMLEWAALLHDVGKIGIRDDVLKKPGKLTREEFEHIKEHPVRSYEVVRDIPQLEAALAGVRHHHEHWDGGGYPDGLKGEEIPRQARIIQVADVFDALTTSRSYRGAFTWRKALGILKAEAGKVADPNLVPVFEKIIERQVREGYLYFENGADEATGDTQ